MTQTATQTLLGLTILLAPGAFASEVKTSGGGSASSGARSSGEQCNVQPSETRCTDNTNFGEKFAETVYKAANGEKSGGQCLMGVRESFQKSCGLNMTPSWGCLSARNAGACFDKLGFKKHEGNLEIPMPPKKGTVFIFEGGEHGHIEVAANVENGKVSYCSDYCSYVRRDVQSPGERRMIAWYEPPE